MRRTGRELGKEAVTPRNPKHDGRHGINKFLRRHRPFENPLQFSLEFGSGKVRDPDAVGDDILVEFGRRDV